MTYQRGLKAAQLERGLMLHAIPSHRSAPESMPSSACRRHDLHLPKAA